MAHQVESMFFHGETPWHGLGVELDHPPTCAEAIVAAGLDWTVSLQTLYAANGTPIDGYRAVVRDSDERTLGVVGEAFRPLQNARAFAFFDPFVRAGQAFLETAGSLRRGARIWILARIAGDPVEVVPGDEVRSYALLGSAHDGSMSNRVGFTPIRVVCANTEALAYASEASRLVRIRHTVGMEESLDAVRDVMDLTRREFAATAEQYRRLARTAIVEADLKRYVKSVFGKEAEASGLALYQPAEAKAERKSHAFETIKRLHEAGRGTEIPGVRGTLWGAYNAVTEYVSHERGRASDGGGRLDAAWFGGGANLNARALNVALSMAA